MQYYQEVLFKIKWIYGDNEYGPVLEYFKNRSANIDYNLANANEHIPEAECNNCTIKEFIHVTFHNLQFQTKHLARETIEKLKFKRNQESTIFRLWQSF